MFKVLKHFENPHQRLESLNSHPTVKNIFLKYNTPVASSAPVEDFLFCDYDKFTKVK